MNILILTLSLLSLVSPLKEVPDNYTLIFKQDFTSQADFEANWDYEIGTGDNGFEIKNCNIIELLKIIFT